MTKRTGKADNGRKALDQQVGALDPRIVELVRFLARRAAEQDYEAMRAVQRNNKSLPERNKDP